MTDTGEATCSGNIGSSVLAADTVESMACVDVAWRRISVRFVCACEFVLLLPVCAEKNMYRDAYNTLHSIHTHLHYPEDT